MKDFRLTAQHVNVMWNFFTIFEVKLFMGGS
jgi:hypothetical protein